MRKLSSYIGLSLGAVIIATIAIIFLFGSTILNSYGKGKLERAFTKAYPDYTLLIGKLHYSLFSNRLVADSASLDGPKVKIHFAQISLSGARWWKFIRGGGLPEVLSKANFGASKIDLELLHSHYGVSSEWAQMSASDSNIVVEGTTVRPLAGDEEFFRASTFRTSRYLLFVPECRVLGLEYADLISGKSYRARSIHLTRASFNVLVNCEKAVEPYVKQPLMVPEALASIHHLMRVDSLNISESNIGYGERVFAGADPGVISFGAVNISVAGIDNQGISAPPITIQAQSALMNAGLLKISMSIPTGSEDLSLHYSGSLGAMDLTQLNAFLEKADQVRIKSGKVDDASFDIDVTAGQAQGHVSAHYADLKLAMLDKKSSSESGFQNRFASFYAKVFKIRNSNAPNAAGVKKVGKVTYTRGVGEQFLHFSWYALRSGIVDLISH